MVPRVGKSLLADEESSMSEEPQKCYGLPYATNVSSSDVANPSPMANCKEDATSCTTFGRNDCNLCFKRFCSISSLKRHLLVHAGLKYSCTYCDKSFTQSNNLKLHIKFKHRHYVEHMRSRMTKSFKNCPEPTKNHKWRSFKNAAALPMEHSTHATGSVATEVKVECTPVNSEVKTETDDDFGLEFAISNAAIDPVKTNKHDGSIINSHMREETLTRSSCSEISDLRVSPEFMQSDTSLEDRQLNYESTSVLFELTATVENGNATNASALCNSEVRSLSDESRCKDKVVSSSPLGQNDCCFCLKRFCSVSSLKRHLLVHTGMRYSCTYCDKSFTQSNNLKLHIKFKHRHYVEHMRSRMPKSFKNCPEPTKNHKWRSFKNAAALPMEHSTHATGSVATEVKVECTPVNSEVKTETDDDFGLEFAISNAAIDSVKTNKHDGGIQPFAVLENSQLWVTESESSCFVENQLLKPNITKPKSAFENVAPTNVGLEPSAVFDELKLKCYHGSDVSDKVFSTPGKQADFKTHSVGRVNFNKKLVSKRDGKTCYHCGRSFLSRSAMKHHIISYHMREETLTRSSCSEVSDQRVFSEIMQSDTSLEDGQLTYESTSGLFGLTATVENGNATNASALCNSEVRSLSDESSCKDKVVSSSPLGQNDCCFCLKRFCSVSSLKRHLLVHTGMRYSCTYCDKSFTQSNNLKLHIKFKHGLYVKHMRSRRPKSFKNCPEPTKNHKWRSFKNAAALPMEHSTHATGSLATENEVKVKCTPVNSEVKTETDDDFGMELACSNAAIDPVKTNKHDGGIQPFAVLENSQLWVTESESSCFVENQLLKPNITKPKSAFENVAPTNVGLEPSAVFDELKLKCYHGSDVSDKVFSTPGKQADFKTHSVGRVNFNKKLISKRDGKTCYHCGRSFLSRSAMKHHIISYHMREETLTRSSCSEVSDQRVFSEIMQSDTSLEDGQLTYESTSGLFGLTATVGNGNATNASALCNSEVRSLSDESSCKDKVVSSSPLGQNDCCFCLKRFCSVSSLKRHLLVHTGMRYSCTYCDKSFTQSNNLKLHIKFKHGLNVQHVRSRRLKSFTSAVVVPNELPTLVTGSEPIEAQVKVERTVVSGEVKTEIQDDWGLGLGCNKNKIINAAVTKVNCDVFEFQPTIVSENQQLSDAGLELLRNSENPQLKTSDFIQCAAVENSALKNVCFKQSATLDQSDLKCSYDNNVVNDLFNNPTAGGDPRTHFIERVNFNEKLVLKRDENTCNLCARSFSSRLALKHHVVRFHVREEASTRSSGSEISDHNIFPLVIQSEIPPETSSDEMHKIYSTVIRSELESETSLDGAQLSFNATSGSVELKASDFSSAPSEEEQKDFPLQLESKMEEVANFDRKTCRICDKRFMSYAHMMRHYRMHTGEKYKCNYCDKEFTQKNNVKRHIVKMHSDVNVLPFVIEHHARSTRRCRDFETISYADRSNVTGGLVLVGKTNMCKESGGTTFYSDEFSSDYTLRLSSGDHGFREERDCNLSNEMTDCFVCGERFTCLDSLELHLRSHDEYGTHKCSICQLSFTESIYLKHHMEIAHNCTPELTVSDDTEFITYADNILTGELTAFRDGLKSVASRFDSDVEPELRFDGVDEDENVQTAFSGESSAPGCVQIKPLKCYLCGKCFSRSDYLKWHLRTHAGEEYKCDYCDKSFADPYGARRHMRLHTCDSQYQCDICQRTFTRSDHLNEHAKKHFGGSSSPTTSFELQCTASTHTEDLRGERSVVNSVIANSWNVPDVKQSALDLRHSVQTVFDSRSMEQISSGFESSEHCALDLRRSVPSALDSCRSWRREINFHSSERAASELIRENPSLRSNDTQPTAFDLCTNKRRMIDPNSSNRNDFICGRLDIVIRKGESTGDNCGQEGVLRSFVKRTDCHICGKRFMRRGNMQRHLKTHAGQKLRCPVCYAIFTRSDNMKKHMASQHGVVEQPHKNGFTWSVGSDAVTILDEQCSSCSDEQGNALASELFDCHGSEVVDGRLQGMRTDMRSTSVNQCPVAENDSWLTISDASTVNEYCGDDNGDVKMEQLERNDDEFVDDESIPDANFKKRETFSITYQQAKIRRGKYMNSNNISHIN